MKLSATEQKRIRAMALKMSSLSNTRVSLKEVGNSIRLYTAFESIAFENYHAVTIFFKGFEQAHALIKMKGE